MSQTEPVTRDLYENPALYDGVRTRRIFAFLVDYTLVLILCIPVAIVVFVMGLLTFGLAWFLYGILFLLVAVPYVGFTLGGANQATPGMRMMGVRLERLDGGRVDFTLAILHSVLFWVGNAVLTPLVLLLSLVLARKQTLHDRLLGTVVVRAHSV